MNDYTRVIGCWVTEASISPMGRLIEGERKFFKAEVCDGPYGQIINIPHGIYTKPVFEYCEEPELSTLVNCNGATFVSQGDLDEMKVDVRTMLANLYPSPGVSIATSDGVFTWSDDDPAPAVSDDPAVYIAPVEKEEGDD